MTWEEFKRVVDEAMELKDLDGGITISRIDLTEHSQAQDLRITTSASGNLIIWGA